jgi:hypothetical protein
LRKEKINGFVLKFKKNFNLSEALALIALLIMLILKTNSALADKLLKKEDDLCLFTSLFAKIAANLLF